jgi:serine/threonine-protein kinase OSR1/STK39
MVVDDKKIVRRTYPTFAEGYKLLECVGRGSEGSVWRALCIPTRKDVAIKIIDLERMPIAAIEDLQQQIHTMYSCSMHPNVVKYYTSFVHGQSLWCVMKYLSGGSCSDIMRAAFPQGLDEASIRVILRGTLDALQYFHNEHHVHRDIKASNIIISESGSVHVADFGVSGSVIEELRTTLCGSPCWMAPEVMKRAWPQNREQEGYDASVDIWSLGITALELAKGRPPLSEYAPSRVFSMVVNNPPPSLSDAKDTKDKEKKKFSSAFKDFVSLCLQKDPSKRPTAAALLKHKFFKGKKNRDYLVSTVLSQLPPHDERSHASVDQTPPVTYPSSQSSITWDFGNVYDPNDPLYANSLESSSSFMSTSSMASTGQSFGATSTLTDGSSYGDSSFFDEWFAAPTPSNTMNALDFANEDFSQLTIVNTYSNSNYYNNNNNNNNNNDNESKSFGISNSNFFDINSKLTNELNSNAN